MRIEWDKVGERLFETGVSNGVLYLRNNAGEYDQGVAWNGLTAVNESPSGAEATAVYADNMKWLNLISAEDYAATIEAYMYPLEFGLCDGTAEIAPGVTVGQQRRKSFGFAYKTRIGNDIEGDSLGYKIHIVYGAIAKPSEKAHSTVNDSPEAAKFSWELSTTPVDIPGLRPSATITVSSINTDPAKLAALEDILYGTEGVEPRLPLPAEVIALTASTVTTVTPTVPTYNGTTHVVTIPTVTGIDYTVGNVVKTGTITLVADQSIIVKAKPKVGYAITAGVDDDWAFTY